MGHQRVAKFIAISTEEGYIVSRQNGSCRILFVGRTLWGTLFVLFYLKKTFLLWSGHGYRRSAFPDMGYFGIFFVRLLRTWMVEYKF